MHGHSHSGRQEAGEASYRANTNGFDAAALRLDTPHEHLLHGYPMSQELGDVRGQCRNVGMTPRCTPGIQHELFELIHCSYPSNTMVIPLYLIVNSILFNRKSITSPFFSTLNPKKISCFHLLARKLLHSGLITIWRPPKPRKGMCLHGVIILRTSESVSPHNSAGPSEDTPQWHAGCPQVQEAILIGLCLSRFGGIETRLYDVIMSRIESSPREPVPIASQCSSAEPTAQALGSANR